MAKKHFFITISGRSRTIISKNNISLIVFYAKGIVIANSFEKAKKIAIENVRKEQNKMMPDNKITYQIDSWSEIEIDFIFADEKLIISS